jgi:hypothetical protein
MNEVAAGISVSGRFAMPPVRTPYVYVQAGALLRPMLNPDKNDVSKENTIPLSGVFVPDKIL